MARRRGQPLPHRGRLLAVGRADVPGAALLHGAARLDGHRGRHCRRPTPRRSCLEADLGIDDLRDPLEQVPRPVRAHDALRRDDHHRRRHVPLRRDDDGRALEERGPDLAHRPQHAHPRLARGPRPCTSGATSTSRSPRPCAASSTRRSGRVLDDLEFGDLAALRHPAQACSRPSGWTSSPARASSASWTARSPASRRRATRRGDGDRGDARSSRSSSCAKVSPGLVTAPRRLDRPRRRHDHDASARPSRWSASRWTCSRWTRWGPGRSPSPTAARTPSAGCARRRAATATGTSSTARRPGSPTAPTPTPSSATPSSTTARAPTRASARCVTFILVADMDGLERSASRCARWASTPRPPGELFFSDVRVGTRPAARAGPRTPRAGAARARRTTSSTERAGVAAMALGDHRGVPAPLDRLREAPPALWDRPICGVPADPAEARRDGGRAGEHAEPRLHAPRARRARARRRRSPRPRR